MWQNSFINQYFSTMNKTFLIILFSLLSFLAYPQIGGESVYSFMEISSSPYSASLGGKPISYVNSPDLIFFNPALLDSIDSNFLSLNYQSYLAGINMGEMIFTTTTHKYGNFAFGIHYINYGEFDKYDEFGNYYGKFTAAEYLPYITYSIQPDSQLTVGINFKTIYSKLENYTSYGYAIDLGLLFRASDNLYFAMVARNIGKQLKPYFTTYEPLPFNISLGTTFKPQYAPFRMTFTFEYLNKWNLRYQSPVNQLYLPPFADTVSTVYKITSALDEFMRHAHLGTEIILSPNLLIMLGYNYRQGKELSLPTIRTLNGFSFGIAIFTSKVNFVYSYRKIMSFGSNSFGITLNFNHFHFRRPK